MSAPKNAAAYLRTSSSSNVGIDKDSDARQREAIHAYAKLADLNVTREFYDKAVSEFMKMATAALFKCDPTNDNQITICTTIHVCIENLS